MSLKRAKTKYNPAWQNNFDWLKPVNNDINAAKCDLCKKVIQIGNSGLTQVKQHSDTEKHKNILALKDGKTSQMTLISSDCSLNLSSLSKCKHT